MSPRPQLLYQRWLECDTLPSPPSLPMWSWPVPLSDGRVLLTLLYRPLRTPSQGRAAPTTVLLELSPDGDAIPWAPGAGYPAPVIFYANPADDLFGLDLTLPGKIYACRPDGAHLFTLDASPRMDCLIAPQSFHQQDSQLFWLSAAGAKMTADLRSNLVENIRSCDSLPPPPDEVHFPHTHFTRDGSLFILDFDPMPRITRYHIQP